MIGRLGRWPDHVAGRIALTVVGALLVIQAISFAVFVWLRPGQPPFVSAYWVAEQVAAAAEQVFAAPADQRRVLLDRIEEARNLSMTWQTAEPQITDNVGGPFGFLRAAVVDAIGDRSTTVRVSAPDFPPGRFRTGPRRRLLLDDGPNRQRRFDAPVPANFTVAVRGADGSWLVVTPDEPWYSGMGLRVGLWLLLVGVAIALLSIWAARRLVLPLEDVAQAAQRLGVDRDAPEVKVSGPAELRAIAAAFNEMHGRIKRFVDDRTQMVAAMSHDLRTPLTRLRLRADAVPDPEQRRKMVADLDQMEAMIAETLSFASDDALRGASEPTDIDAMLASICDDFSDAGRNASYTPSARMVTMCRPGALRRALTNLIDNAITHGGAARVALSEGDGAITITVTDDGPGIPENELEKVFQPFYRLDASRNRDLGGTGLGLAVARTILRAHGGDVTLANRDGGGLVATVKLPKVAPG
jgi:signal transduction histidine kinase